MITLDYTPIEVELNVETGNLTQEAFYTVGFITANDTAPRTVIVNSLQDLLDSGYLRGSNAYNFCKGVLLQGKMNTVVVRAKRASETYSQAFLADDNSNYYYVVIGSKSISDITSFNDTLASERELKLQFFSTNTNVSASVLGRKIVYYSYYTPVIDPSNPTGIVDFPYLALDSGSGVLTDLGYFIYLDPYSSNNPDPDLEDPYKEYVLAQSGGADLTYDQAQARALRYPEAAWIGLCGDYFPSQVQWLYKNLLSVEPISEAQIPDLSTTTVLMPSNGDKSTLGSGTSCEGYQIHEVVSLDWVEYALRKKLWEVFYNTEKIPSTNAGLSMLENAVRYVLDIAVQMNIFTEYKITGRKLASSLSRASFTFEATLTQTILEVKKVEGTIYH